MVKVLQLDAMVGFYGDGGIFSNKIKQFWISAGQSQVTQNMIFSLTCGVRVYFGSWVIFV